MKLTPGTVCRDEQGFNYVVLDRNDPEVIAAWNERFPSYPIENWQVIARYRTEDEFDLLNGAKLNGYYDIHDRPELVDTLPEHWNIAPTLVCAECDKKILYADYICASCRLTAEGQAGIIP